MKLPLITQSKSSKIEEFSGVFKPVPFVGCKDDGFLRHEVNLRNLGLWDFLHIEFDTNIRVDLILELVANYALKNRASRVCGYKIMVNRTDLARALKLPLRLPVKNCPESSFPVDFLSFLELFVSNWILLHERRGWVTPEQIVDCMSLIKEGHPQRVDWAGMVWIMMKKELAQGLKLEECYYASHLQQLIKVQKSALLLESTKLVVENHKVDEMIVEKNGRDVRLDDSSMFKHGGKRGMDFDPKSTRIRLEGYFREMVDYAKLWKLKFQELQKTTNALSLRELDLEKSLAQEKAVSLHWKLKFEELSSTLRELDLVKRLAKVKAGVVSWENEFKVLEKNIDGVISLQDRELDSKDTSKMFREEPIHKDVVKEEEEKKRKRKMRDELQ